MQSIIDRVKIHEGLKLKPYRDSNGFWTIGYGHKLRLASDIPTTEITPYDAEELLMGDLYRASDRYVLWSRRYCCWLDVVRAGVCVELIFWVGFRGFTRFKKMIDALDGRDYPLAALELYNSTLGKEHSRRARTLAVLMWEGA